MLLAPARLAILFVVLAGAAIGGCGGSGHDATTGATATAKAAPTVVLLDTKRVARAIEASVLEKRSIHATVRCPARVPQRKGLTFSCVATTDAGQTTFAVEQQDSLGHVYYAAH